MRPTTARSLDRSIILAATVVLACRQYGFPSAGTWRSLEKDHPSFFIGLILIAGIFGVLTPFEHYARRARTERRVSMRRQILTAFGQLIELRGTGAGSAPISDLGLHIWQKRRTMRHPMNGELARVATYRLGSTPITRSLRPTSGIGVVGLCWRLDQEVGRDVEDLAGRITDRQMFEDYRMEHGADAVMSFSWDEFRRYSHRGAVFASPIRNGRASFVGCVSLDAANGYDKLNTERMWHELNSLCVVLGHYGFEDV